MSDAFGPAGPSKHLWSVVLAGGEGSRTREFIKRRLGVSIPKQYCCFAGTRTLLQHTVDRADALSRPEQRVVVVAREHRGVAAGQMAGHAQGRLVAQPANRGTAAGVFLPLTLIRASDPDATVVIYPSDHFVHPAAAFVESMARAISVTHRIGDRVLLLAARPDGPETSYGWILPGGSLLGRHPSWPRQVASFVEKPVYEVARRAFLGGGLWNTSIVIARLKTLWELGWDHLPGMMARLARLGGDSPGHGLDEPAVERAYADMPVLDFSRHLLQNASSRLAVMPLSAVYWNDWGSPERILDTLGREEFFRRSPRERASPVSSREQEGVAGVAVT